MYGGGGGRKGKHIGKERDKEKRMMRIREKRRNIGIKMSRKKPDKREDKS